jgi:hypothetical protein
MALTHHHTWERLLPGGSTEYNSLHCYTVKKRMIGNLLRLAPMLEKAMVAKRFLW